MKNLILKTTSFVILIAFSTIILSCKKKDDTQATKPDTYSSLYDFYVQNGVKSGFYNINAATGGNFTTPQGTKVTINPNSFVDYNNNPVTGTITIEFKDIYNKSDMLLSKMPTMLGNGAPLESGGEFFINAEVIKGPDTTFLNLAKNKGIMVQQPFNGKDSAMQPFVIDSVANNWTPAPTHTDTLVNFASSYIFSLYQFSNPYQRGTWCNSDNPDYFNGYTKTNLTVYPGFNLSDYNQNMDVYLVFKGLKTMIHVYDDSNVFPYLYAPIGLQCTVVAVGVKDNNLWASFTPVSIINNQSVTISVAKTTTADFISKLKALDN